MRHSAAGRALRSHNRRKFLAAGLLAAAAARSRAFAFGQTSAGRAALGLASIARLSPDPDSQRVNPQPEHIEPAGALGLGEFHLKKIKLKKFDLG